MKRGKKEGRAVMSIDVKAVISDVIMTRQEVADWLRVKPRQIDRMGVPQLLLGRKTIRYLKSDVLDWLQHHRIKDKKGEFGP